jgi:hypothetical protein
MCKGLFPWELFAVTIGRDVMLIGSGLIIRGLEKEKESAFFDASSATFEIVPTQLSKVTTCLPPSPLPASSLLLSSSFSSRRLTQLSSLFFSR